MLGEQSINTFTCINESFQKKRGLKQPVFIDHLTLLHAEGTELYEFRPL